ncbi:hypothetical protein OHPBIL_OHPBIL_15290, partial [Dysosmobacter welbionis]
DRKAGPHDEGQQVRPGGCRGSGVPGRLCHCQQYGGHHCQRPHGQKHEPYPQSGSPPHRLSAGRVLLRASGHDPLGRPAADCRQPHHDIRSDHEPHRHPALYVVLLDSGRRGHPLHFHSLRRRHLPQGPLELGVRCGGVRRGCQEGFS